MFILVFILNICHLIGDSIFRLSLSIWTALIVGLKSIVATARQIWTTLSWLVIKLKQIILQAVMYCIAAVKTISSLLARQVGAAVKAVDTWINKTASWLRKKTLIRPTFINTAKTRHKKAIGITTKPAWYSRVIGLVVVLNVALVSFMTIQFGPSVSTWWKAIPNPQSLQDFTVPAATMIYDRDGVLLYSTYHNQYHLPIPLSQVPPMLVDATLAAEDERFYSHVGVDPVAIGRAVLNNLGGGNRQGASTLTQQVARTAFLTNQKTLERKLEEAVIAARMEQHFSKSQILELYFNVIPYGGSAVGIEAAAQQYFGKSAQDLTEKEAIFLASITPAPSKYGRNQQKDNPQIVYVLDRLLASNKITEEKYQLLLNEPLNFNPVVMYKRAPHAVDYILAEVEEQFGEDALEQGLKIYSSIDLDLQQQFQQLVTTEVITKQKQYRFTNGSALAVTPSDGRIISLVGSADYYASPSGQVSVVTAPRQFGSTLKVVTYAYALEHGYTPQSILEDSPVVFKTYNNYTPRNYDGRFHGNVALQKAFANSYNIPVLKLAHKLGVQNISAYGYSMGIEEFGSLNEKQPLSLSIGGVETTLEHVVQSYQVVANNGQKVKISAIDRVADYQGNVLYTRNPQPIQVMSSNTARSIYGILSDAQLRRPTFGSPAYFNFKSHKVAIKTGTSNNLKDNAAVAFTPDLVVGTWVGNNDGTSMRAVSSGYSGASALMHPMVSTMLNYQPQQKVSVLK